jgi:hypothetical protein
VIAYDGRVTKRVRGTVSPGGAFARPGETFASWLGLGAAMAGLLWLAGCAGRAPAPHEPRPAPSRSVPDRILEDEVLIEDLRATVGDDSLGCPDLCRASASICEAAERICGVVSELRDVSLAPRCDRARASCREAAGTVSSCGCTPLSRP